MIFHTREDFIKSLEQEIDKFKYYALLEAEHVEIIFFENKYFLWVFLKYTLREFLNSRIDDLGKKLVSMK